MKIENLLSNLDNKKLILVGLVSLAILYLDISVFFKMQTGINSRLKSKISKLKKDMRTLNLDLDKMRELEKKISQTGKGADLKVKRLISEEEVTGVLQYISGIAKANDIQVAQMRPSRESAAPVKNIKGAQPQRPSSLLVNLDLFCGYHDLGKFINELENGQIFFAVQNMKISPQPSDYLKQRVNLAVVTHVKK